MATSSSTHGARIHFLSADSGLGKTTALSEFARHASAAGQPVGGVLCPVGADGLRTMLCLSTGEQRTLQMVQMTEADATRRRERLEMTDARTRSTMDSTAAEVIAAEQGEHGIAVGPFVFDKRVFEWAQATELGGGCVDGLNLTTGADPRQWVIIDEVGPLELRRNQGLEPALSAFLRPPGVLSAVPTVDVIVVVRPSLRDQLPGYFGLPREMCDEIQWVLKDGFIDPSSLTFKHSSGPPRTDFQNEEEAVAAAAAHRWGLQPQPTGAALPAWTPPQLPSHPEGGFSGRSITLVKLDIVAHGDDLWRAFMTPPSMGGCPTEADLSTFQQSILDRLWTYLPIGPYTQDEREIFDQDLSTLANDGNVIVSAVIDNHKGIAIGLISLMRMQPAVGVIEIGWVVFSPQLQRTRGATETLFILLRHCFDLGYRRVEWKCDSLNAPSQAAAVRFGFSYEGTFRKCIVYKGRNRDTAWFAMLDDEWDGYLRSGYEAWLADENHDELGQQRRAMRDLHAEAKHRLGM